MTSARPFLRKQKMLDFPYLYQFVVCIQVPIVMKMPENQDKHVSSLLLRGPHAAKGCKRMGLAGASGARASYLGAPLLLFAHGRLGLVRHERSHDVLGSQDRGRLREKRSAPPLSNKAPVQAVKDRMRILCSAAVRLEQN